MEPIIAEIENLMRQLIEEDSDAILRLEKLLSKLRVEHAVEKSTSLN